MSLRFGVDPYVVDYVWPMALRERALAFMEAEVAIQKKQEARRKRGN